jgi:hypothetical protein
VSNRAVDAAYAAGWAAIKRLPERAAYATFAGIGDHVWRRRGRGVTQLERNLRRVVGASATPEQMRELSRRAMRSYCRYWCDVFRLPVWSRERVVASVTTENEKVFRAGLDSGHGLIVALHTLGQLTWPVHGRFTAAPLTTVAERLHLTRCTTASSPIASCWYGGPARRRWPIDHDPAGKAEMWGRSAPSPIVTSPRAVSPSASSPSRRDAARPAALAISTGAALSPLRS